MTGINSFGQRDICKKYNAEYVPPLTSSMIAVSKDISTGDWPINGLRYLEEGNSSGWFIWAGEYSERDDFFVNIHLSHMLDMCPIAIKYLALPAGWRFLCDEEYEDVWFDDNLFKI